MTKMRFTLKMPMSEDWKNPKEGKSLGQKPDGEALNEYPINFPKGADEEVERSIWGSTENQKTFHQGEGLEEKQKK